MAKSEKKEVKRIGILSLAKIAGLIGVIYGFVSGIVISVLYSQIAKVPTALASELTLISQMGYKSLYLLPLLNGVGYFIAGFVAAFVYNVLAKWVGGVKIYFKD